MALPIPPLQDIVRLTGHDVPTTAQNYRKHLRSTGPVWGYDRSKRLAKAVFSLNMTREAAVAACAQGGHPLGHSHNAEVGGLVWDIAHERGQFMCHDISPRSLQLRADFSIRVDPQFFFVQDGRPVIFYLQPRRGHVPRADGLRVIASAIHSLFAVDELLDANLLLADLSNPPGSDQRGVALHDFNSLPPMDNLQLERFFQRFVDAYDIVTKEGTQPAARRVQPERERGEDLFGGLS